MSGWSNYPGPMDYPTPGKGTGPAGEPTRNERREQHAAMVKILKNGGQVTLGTPAARETFAAGAPALAALLVAQFTPEEMDVIMDGAQ